MPLQPTTVCVLPNPWCALDGEGRPAGVCNVDPDVFGVSRIGAKIASVEVEQLSPHEVSAKARILVAPRQRITWAFTDEPVTVSTAGESGKVIRKKIRTRELVAADRESAKWAGVEFMEPAELLKQAKAAARERFDAYNYPGAFDKLAAERGEPMDARNASTTSDSAGEPSPAKRSKA